MKTYNEKSGRKQTDYTLSGNLPMLDLSKGEDGYEDVNKDTSMLMEGGEGEEEEEGSYVEMQPGELEQGEH